MNTWSLQDLEPLGPRRFRLIPIPGDELNTIWTVQCHDRSGKMDCVRCTQAMSDKEVMDLVLDISDSQVDRPETARA